MNDRPYIWNQGTPLDLLKENTKYLTEAKQLSSGIFWVIADDNNLSNFKFLFFEIPCDVNGKPDNTHTIELNAKSMTTYNHKKLWESEIQNKSEHKPYNKMDYDYYPRGRVEISNNRATIYLNPHINSSTFISKIKQTFGLSTHNIPEVRVIVDGSVHYQCFLDKK